MKEIEKESMLRKRKKSSEHQRRSKVKSDKTPKNEKAKLKKAGK
jgi:hypothetical protein